MWVPVCVVSVTVSFEIAMPSGKPSGVRPRTVAAASWPRTSTVTGVASLAVSCVATLRSMKRLTPLPLTGRPRCFGGAHGRSPVLGRLRAAVSGAGIEYGSNMARTPPAEFMTPQRNADGFTG